MESLELLCGAEAQFGEAGAKGFSDHGLSKAR